MSLVADRGCGACGLITEGELVHDCDLAPAGMATIATRLELVEADAIDDHVLGIDHIEGPGP